MYLLTSFGILTTFGFFCKNRLLKLLGKREKKVRFFFIALKLVFLAVYIKICQMCNKSLKKIDKNTYELTYVLGNRKFRYQFKPVLGPSPVLLVTDGDEEDVTTELKELMGPMYNWHGTAAVTPDLLGYSSLCFELSTGQENIYNGHDVIPNF